MFSDLTLSCSDAIVFLWAWATLTLLMNHDQSDGCRAPFEAKHLHKNLILVIECDDSVEFWLMAIQMRLSLASSRRVSWKFMHELTWLLETNSRKRTFNRIKRDSNRRLIMRKTEKFRWSSANPRHEVACDNDLHNDSSKRLPLR